MIVNTAYSSMFKPVVRPTYGGHVMNMHYGTYADAAPILTISRVLMTRTGLQTVNVRVEWNVISASYVSRYYCELRDSDDNVLDSVRTNDRYCDFTCTIGEAFYVSVTTNNPYYYGYAKTDVITPYIDDQPITISDNTFYYYYNSNIAFERVAYFRVVRTDGLSGGFSTPGNYFTSNHSFICEFSHLITLLNTNIHYYVSIAAVSGYSSRRTEFYKDEKGEIVVVGHD